MQSKAEWTPDDQCVGCERCEMPFGVFRRRHHCRRCGGVFCHKCSINRVRGLPGYEDTLQRVCSGCTQALQALKEVGKKRPRERRVCILGSPGNGELSLLHFMCPDASNHDHQKVVTFGKTRQMSHRGGEFEYIFSVVDTGQTGCDLFQPQYTIGTHAYVLMFNVADRNSFLALLPLRDRVLECGGLEKVMILVGNRPSSSSAAGSGSAADRQVSAEEMSLLARRWGIPHTEISTSKQRQVDELKGLLLGFVAERDHPCG